MATSQVTRHRTFADTVSEVRASGVTSCIVGADPERYIRDTARTVHRWRTLAALEYVRLRAEDDLFFDPNNKDFAEDVFDEDDEAFGSIGEYRVRPYGEWTHGDSCWGHVGYDDVLSWKENGYILDIMDETLDAFVAAHKDRVRGLCNFCHGTGKAS